MFNEESLVTRTLSSLRKRLNDNGNIIQVQNEQGHLFYANCTFRPPVSDIDLSYFENESGFILPADYKEFLKITNGCRLFDDIQFGGEIELYSLEQIIESNFEHQGYDEYEGCYDIAYIYQDNIVINSKLVSQNRGNYLFWKDHIDQFKEARPLNMNFELWFDRFVVSQGTKFWWWSIHTAEWY